MAITPTVKAQWFDGKRLWIHLALVFSGSYVTGGDTLNLTGLGLKCSQPTSMWASIDGQALGANGTQYVWIPGTTLANGKVGVTQGAGVEIAASTYPASVSGDTVNMMTHSLFNR
jgi:hypothetical protein